MILGLGADVVAVARVDALLARYGDRFLARVFTPAERSDCLGRARPAVHLAARLAAKEAAMKALGTGWGDGVSWQDLAVASTRRRVPALQLSGGARRQAERLGIRRTLVSLSHDGAYAFAVVVAEGEAPGPEARRP
ncbi:MAG: holo-ACP synthase [Candidatus Methylomirabilales bacterium]